jgi:quercetin dioxygenase-like cupin family protein
MPDYRIPFASLPWESPVPGVRQKIVLQDNRKLRLVEFSDQLREPDWCRKGHLGYVLEGRLTIDFHGRIVAYQAGDGLCIPPGEEHRHRANVAPGEKAVMVLVEEG